MWSCKVMLKDCSISSRYSKGITHTLLKLHLTALCTSLSVRLFPAPTLSDIILSPRQRAILQIMQEKILIVDDERLIRRSLSEALRGWGYVPLEAVIAAEAIAAFDAEQPAVTLLDINLPDRSGIEVLYDIKKRQKDAIVIMITANVIVDDTIAALRAGAYDFIGKPINLEELEVTIRNALEARELRSEVGAIRQARAREFSFGQIITGCAAMQDVLHLARRVADSDVSSILLQGESGTGKDLIAKAIHYSSERADKPFVAINCAAIPANLVESELFGYEKGAFTDAKARKQGILEQADGGTIFLDEIGELELNLQAKLLRVLEENAFRRVGGLKDIPLRARVIAASNRDLRSESEAGRFRLDLYYRLSVIQIDVPPLRERGDDVILLAEHFLEHFRERLRRKNIRGLAPEVKEAFRRYRWPGNVRELRNAIERAMILEESDLITLRYLPGGIASEVTSSSTATNQEPDDDIDSMFRLPPEGVSLDAVETSLVRQALALSKGNQGVAASLLRISRDRLRYRLLKIQEKGEA